MSDDCKKLLDGFARFVEREYDGRDAAMPRLIEQGQNPDYVIVSCIDSRSNPGTVFQVPPGTFFGHKAMGAIVRPYRQGTALSATLQFAIKYNGVKTIIVLGHTGCGAIKALIDKIPDPEISSFIEVAQTGLEKVQAQCKGHEHNHDLQRETEEQIVLQSVENLHTYPCVREALDAGTVQIKPWLFCMEEGALYEYRAQSGRFEKISA